MTQSVDQRRDAVVFVLWPADAKAVNGRRSVAVGGFGSFHKEKTMRIAAAVLLVSALYAVDSADGGGIRREVCQIAHL